MLPGGCPKSRRTSRRVFWTASTAVMPALDLDLREGARKRRLRPFQFVALEGARFKQLFGAFHRDFGRLFVDVLFVDRAIGQDGDAGAGDFGKAFANGEDLHLALARDA